MLQQENKQNKGNPFILKDTMSRCSEQLNIYESRTLPGEQVLVKGNQAKWEEFEKRKFHIRKGKITTIIQTCLKGLAIFFLWPIYFVLYQAPNWVWKKYLRTPCLFVVRKFKQIHASLMTICQSVGRLISKFFGYLNKKVLSPVRSKLVNCIIFISRFIRYLRIKNLAMFAYLERLTKKTFNFLKALTSFLYQVCKETYNDVKSNFKE